MADVTKSIKKTGGDYSTVQAAIDAYSTQADTGWYKCEIQDSEEYVEDITINESVSSPSSTHYIWLTAHPDNRHSGVAGTGHARLKQNSIFNIRVYDSYTRIDWLDITNDRTADYTQGVSINATTVNSVLVSYCILRNSGGHVLGHNAIQNLNRAGTMYVDNCVIYGWGRAGVFLGNSTNVTSSIDVDHCTVYDCGRTGDGASGAIRMVGDTGDTRTITAYNTIGCGTNGSYTDFSDGNSDTSRLVPSGTVTWNGSHNLHTSSLTDVDGTDNTTNWQDASSGGATTTTTTANAVIFSNLTSGSEDLTLVAATGAGSNLAVDNGTNRIGSEPDTRQDFSVDITGATRATTGVDLGAFVLAGADPLTLEGFRFRADDGNETGATWLEAQDVNVVRLPGNNTRLRALIDATGDPASQAYKLQWRVKTTGTWTDVEDG